MTNPEYELVELQQLIRKELADLKGMSDAEFSARFDSLNRSGMLALHTYGESQSPDPIGLFWVLYPPHRDSKNRPAAALPAEWEEAILKSLERLYHRHQISYEPDAGIPVENDFQESLISGHQLIPGPLRDLITFIHIAAAWAFRIKRAQGGGLDEVALDCLREVNRAMVRLSLLNRSERGIGEVLNRDPAQTFLLSTYAVGAKALAELGLVQHRQGNYAEALHYIARAVFEASYAAAHYVADEPYAAESDMEGVALATSLSLNEHLISGLDNITHQEIASVWQKLKEVGQPDSWVRVDQDCNYMLEAFEQPYLFSNQDGYPVPGIIDWFQDFTVTTDPALAAVGAPLTWTEFWYGAKVWVSAQVSAGDLLKLRDTERKTASENRLRNYFFGQDWAGLPESAKLRLVEADRIWNSPETMAWEAVLNDFRIAVEEMCQTFLWQPLTSSNTGVSPALLENLKQSLEPQGRIPIAGCRTLCKDGGFADFLRRRKASPSDIKFLTCDLPTAMDWLRRPRNRAEHESHSWSRDEVRPYFNRFLGVNEQGILPELARIGRKLRRV